MGVNTGRDLRIKDMTARFVHVLLGGGLGNGAVHIADTLHTRGSFFSGASWR